MNRRLGLLLLLVVTSHAANGGTVAGIAAGETLSAGMVRTIALPDHVVPEPGKNEMELVLSLDDGVSFPLRVSSEVPVDTTWLVFRVPNFPTATARLGLRVGRDGREEQLRVVSETFSIAPSPDAPLEVLRAVRGEPATRDVRDAAGWPPVPEGLSE